MPTATIKIADYEVGRVGYGAMQLTGPSAMGEPADPQQSAQVLQQAIDSGVRLIDTSGYYGPEVANRIIASSLAPYPADLLIATKVGVRRTPEGGFAADATPEAIRAAVFDNLRVLRLDQLSLVHARYMPDTTVPFAETVGALADLKSEGLVANIGVSNVTAELLKKAQSVTTIASVENEFRLGSTKNREVLDITALTDIPYLAFRPLGNGALLSNAELRTIANRAGISPATLALAWILDQSENTVVIPGSSTMAHLTENLAAQSYQLTPELRDELTRLE